MKDIKKEIGKEPTDDRFADLVGDEDYQVNPDHPMYRIRHQKKKIKKARKI